MIALALARRSGTVVASSALCFACACARADEAVSVQSVLEDTKLYFTAPLRWDGEDWA